MPAIGSNQNESAFRRGNAMSGAPSISGTAKFARPAKAGMMKTKIISAACIGDEPVVGLRVHELHARLGELGAEEHRHQAADREEDERRHEVLDADHLVVGVDLEVVLPRACAPWLGVVLRAASGGPRSSRASSRTRRCPSRNPTGAEREPADEHDDVPVVDRIPAGEPANARRRGRARRGRTARSTRRHG